MKKKIVLSILALTSVGQFAVQNALMSRQTWCL